MAENQVAQPVDLLHPEPPDHRLPSSWLNTLPAVAIVLLGLSFGLIPLLRGELFLFNDNGEEYYPHTEFLVQALKSWTIPQWWPQVGTGIPVIAEGEAHYTPIRLLLAAVLDAPASFMAEISLYFALAGLGTYLFLRRIKLHPLAASAGAIGFMFGSQLVVYVRDMGLLRAACFFPWVIWLAESSFRGRRPTRVLWLAPPLLALQFLSGNPVFAVIALVALFCYLTLRTVSSIWLAGPPFQAELKRGLGLLSVWVLITILGVGMASIQVVPTMQHVPESVRAGGFTLEYAANSNHSKITDFPHAFFPYVYGLRNPVIAVAGFYDGALIAVAFFFILFCIRRTDTAAWCLLLSGGLATLLALGSYTPVYGLLWHFPLLNGLRFPLRYQFWASFCFACLGAIGLHRVAGWSENTPSVFVRLRPVLALAAFIFGVAVMFWRLRPTKHSELLWCILLLLAALALVFSLSMVKKALIVLTAINILLLIDLGYFRFYAGYAPGTKIADGLKNDGLAGWLRQDRSRFRILALLEPEYLTEIALRPELRQGDFRLQNILSGSAPALWGLESVRYHGSLELRRFEKVVDALTSTLQNEPEQASKLSPFLDFLQTKYVVARRGFVFNGWEKCQEEGAMAAWRLPNFRGGEFLVGNVEQENTPDDESIIHQIRSRSIDFRRTAIIDSRELPELNGVDERAEVARLPARYDEMSFQVTSDRPALLVIPTNFYPGWTATVNGRAARIYRTNWIGMGVLVDAGKSTVDMQFTTPGFRVGIGLSILSLVAWLGISIACGKLRWLRFPAGETAATETGPAGS